MLVPRGELVKDDVKPSEVLYYLDKKLRKKKLKVKHGYLEGSITTVYGHFEFKIVFKDKKIVSAEVIKTNTKTVWRSYEAIKIICYLLLLATRSSNIITNIKLFKVDKKLLQLGEEILSVEDITSVVDSSSEDILREITHDTGSIYEDTTVSEVLQNIRDDFTGIIVGETKSGNYYAKLYVKNGEIVGAFIRMDGREIRGTEATYYLDEECNTVKVQRMVTVIVPEGYEVEEEEIKVEDIKLDDKLNELLESLKSRKS